VDVTPLLIWWLIILIFGLVGWPVAFNLLRHLPDRGFALARPVGLLLAGYVLWLGGTFRLLRNNSAGILIALVVVLIVGLLWRRRSDDGMIAWLKREWRYALAVELLFSTAFIGWTIFKAYNPDIETAGGEKWMEIAFINGVLGSAYFPPQDPWLSGFGISYYYFGYVLMAMVTRLTGLVSTVAFNLYAPTLLAMTLAGAVGVVANLVALHRGEPTLTLPATLTGLLGALFVALLGNLTGLMEVLHKRGLLAPDFWLWLDMRDLREPPLVLGDSWLPDRFIWWWRASRVIIDYGITGHEQEMIDEFPFFSFLLGDVHPHVLALPFVLVVVALALNLLVNKTTPHPRPLSLWERGDSPSPSPPGRGGQGGEGVDKWGEFLQNIWREVMEAVGGRLAFGLTAICLGGLSFLNTWDFPIYLSVVGLALARRRRQLTTTIAGTGLLGLAGVLLYLPFYVTFQSQARGLLPNLWNPTRLPQFFVFWGPFLVAVIGLLAITSIRRQGWQKHLRWTLPLALAGPVLAMLAVLSAVLLSPAGQEYIQGILNQPQVQALLGDTTASAILLESLHRRVTDPWVFLLVGLLIGWALALLAGLGEASRPEGNRVSPAEQFALILVVVGLALPLAVEFIYLRDNFGYRMNTVFKFYFQGWVLLALASAFGVYYVSNADAPRASGGFLPTLATLAWQGAVSLLVAAGLIYPVLATAHKANYFEGEPTLNAIQWISHRYPGDYAAIAWLRQNAPPGAVILETPAANHAAYQYAGRVSAMTGLPTLLGWGGHQSQWRGNYDEPGRREPDIATLFNTIDIAQAQALLDKYNVTYVYVGPLERESYAPQGLKKFGQFMAVAFHYEEGGPPDEVIIYRRQ
jgi:YYY domain-containing protein